jgi:hypothetical protein
MAIEIEYADTREAVRLAIQTAVRKQLEMLEAVNEVEDDLDLDLINLESLVNKAAREADWSEPYELSELDFRVMLRKLRVKKFRIPVLPRRYRAAAACIGMLVVTPMCVRFLYAGQLRLGLVLELLPTLIYSVWVYRGRTPENNQ